MRRGVEASSLPPACPKASPVSQNRRRRPCHAEPVHVAVSITETRHATPQPEPCRGCRTLTRRATALGGCHETHTDHDVCPHARGLDLAGPGTIQRTRLGGGSRGVRCQPVLARTQQSFSAAAIPLDHSWHATTSQAGLKAGSPGSASPRELHEASGGRRSHPMATASAKTASAAAQSTDDPRTIFPVRARALVSSTSYSVHVPPPTTWLSNTG